MFNLDDLMTIDPQYLWLTLSSSEQQAAKSQVQSQSYSSSIAHQRAYCNLLCLNAIAGFLSEEPDLPNATLWANLDDQASIWELVNGGVLIVDGTRIALFPTESDQPLELCVEQEWMDIPTWAAHYYLLVQMNVAEGWLCVVGYTTYDQLKQAGDFDPVDRMYRLDCQELSSDLNELWISREVVPAWDLAVEPVATIPQETALHLITQLSEPTVYSPRLDVPFSRWAALIAHSNWRTQLYRQRTTIDLNRLLKQPLTGWWQTFVETLQPPPAIASATPKSGGTSRGSRQILTTQIQLGEHHINLLVLYEVITKKQLRVQFEIRATDLESVLPTGLQLRLLNAEGQSLWRVQGTANKEALELPPVKIPSHDTISLKLTLGEAVCVKTFTYLPEQNQPESDSLVQD